jgi:hypothetical protein
MRKRFPRNLRQAFEATQSLSVASSSLSRARTLSCALSLSLSSLAYSARWSLGAGHLVRVVTK